MRRRKIKAFIAELPRFILLCPLYPVVLVLLFVRCRHLTSVAATCGTIRIIAEPDEDEQTFVAVTRRALALIEKHDARRYARLQNELRYIQDVPITSFGSYDRCFRVCIVDFSHLLFDWENKDALNYADWYAWYLARYAALLVHEATHGRLEHSGFPYNKWNRVQIERICEAEARRFAARLPQTPYHFARDLIPPFDASRWDYWWNTPRLQQAKDGWRRAMR